MRGTSSIAKLVMRRVLAAPAPPRGARRAAGSRRPPRPAAAPAICSTRERLDREHHVDCSQHGGGRIGPAHRRCRPHREIGRCAPAPRSSSTRAPAPWQLLRDLRNQTDTSLAGGALSRSAPMVTGMQRPSLRCIWPDEMLNISHKIAVSYTRHDRHRPRTRPIAGSRTTCGSSRPRRARLSQHVLRTDVAGMPLEWIDYKEAARLYHQEQVAYTCGTLLYRLYGGVNALHRPAHRPGGQFHHRHRRAHRQSGQYARTTTCRRSTTRPCSGATPTCACTAACASRRASCRATTSRPSAGAARHLEQRRDGLPALQQPQGVAHARSRRSMQLSPCRSRRTTRNTSSSRAGACSRTRWSICWRISRARARCTSASSAGHVSAAACADRVRSSFSSTRRYFVFRAYHSMLPDMVDATAIRRTRSSASRASWAT